MAGARSGRLVSVTGNSLESQQMKRNPWIEIPTISDLVSILESSGISRYHGTARLLLYCFGWVLIVVATARCSHRHPKIFPGFRGKGEGVAVFHSVLRWHESAFSEAYYLLEQMVVMVLSVTRNEFCVAVAGLYVWTEESVRLRILKQERLKHETNDASSPTRYQSEPLLP